MAAKLQPTNDAPAKIKKLSDRPVYIKGLVYADPGAGKTWLLGTAPKALMLLGEPHVADPTLRALKSLKGIDLDVWEIEELEDISDAYEFLESGKHNYETLLIDGITDINKRIQRAVVQGAVSKRDTHDPDILEQSDWNRVGEKTRYIIRMFRDLPMHVIMSALVMDIRNEMKFVPYVQPKSMAQELASYFNLVGYLGLSNTDTNDDGTPVRKLIVQPSDQITAKNPGGILPAVVANPDFTDLFTLIIEGLKQ